MVVELLLILMVHFRFIQEIIMLVGVLNLLLVALLLKHKQVISVLVVTTGHQGLVAVLV